MRDDSDADDEDATCADTNAETLREEELIVRAAERSHHQAKDHHEGAEEDNRFGMAAVEERTGEDGDAAGEECLDRADPGYSAVIATRNEGRGVVCLKNTEGIQEAPINWSVQNQKDA